MAKQKAKNIAPAMASEKSNASVAQLEAENLALREALEESNARVAQLETTILEQTTALDNACSTMAEMRQQMGLLQKMLFGRKSERYVDDGTPLLPGFVLPEPDRSGEPRKRTKVGDHERTKPDPHRNAGWKSFPEDLPREVVILDLPESEKEGLQFVRYETSERLVYRTSYLVRIHKRAIYAVPNRPALGLLSAAPAPNELSENSDRARYDLSVQVHVITEKFINHLPFYRQSESLRRQGINIGRSLMGKWMMDIGELLRPLYSRLVTLVMSSPVIHADETTIRRLDRGKCRRCHIWVRKTGTDPPLTVFHFAAHRNQETALQLMGNYLGTYVSDACSAYDPLPGTRSACWAHARRKFYEAPDGADLDRQEALGLIGMMYHGERQAMETAAESDSPTALDDARRDIRKKTSVYVDAYFRLCEAILTGSRPPSDPLVKAAGYSWKQKDKLRVFLNNPLVPIDNNPAENAIRPWALGRKNWLFVGNDHGGEIAALINSMVITCKDNKVNFEAWLLDILPRLSTTLRQDIDTLLPHLWRPLQN